MSDLISPAERQAIDAAVNAGRMSRVPAGVSAFPYPVWIGGKLVGEETTNEHANAAARRRANGARNTQITAACRKKPVTI